VKKLAAFVSLLLAIALAPRAEADTLKIGSKRFTESYILAEIVRALAEESGEAATHTQGLGGTAIVYRALEEGSIDLYPEYTGTIAETVLHMNDASFEGLRAGLASKRIGMTGSLGFQNTYALAVPKRVAGVTRISDLAARPELRIGLSHEFLGRSDGWPGLAARYGLAPDRARGLDHGLSYEALDRGAIDVLDVYSTDAKIARYDLVTLKDDRAFFPRYDAVFLYREDVPTRFPRTWARVRALEGAITEARMIQLNAEAELGGRAFADVGASFVRGGSVNAPAKRTFFAGLVDSAIRHGPRHLELVLASVSGAIVVGVPLGALAQRRRRIGAALLAVTGVVQTIPALALLCFFIPALGIGSAPTLAALFLYSLLPIVRNTYTALEDIPPSLREAAEAIGLDARDRLLRVELPMGTRTILAGIRTSAVVNVGTATIAAFIGAGGFGEPISTGLNLNDTSMILQGAVPAAVLAVLVEGLFVLLERAVVPRGLTISRNDQE
jgi:osmoprotectant transport system permease protein